MYTTKQIIENQKLFKEIIIASLLKEHLEAKKILIKIESPDSFIMNEKQKLLKRFCKTKTIDSINKYFFNFKKRDENYYAWWDEMLQEVKILKYGKK